MANQATKQVNEDQAFKQAVQNQANKVKRPNVKITGKSKNSKVTFDNVPDGIKLPAGLGASLNMYYDVIDTLGGKIQAVSLEDIDNARPASWDKEYDQLPSEHVTHYKPEIEGATAWKHKQGVITIGKFS
tara:strand:+ start:114 stop:503 length:390 start_codon:yes stop_codon:yes gene_type:complete